MFSRTTTPSMGRMVITKALAEKPAKGVVYFLHGACDDGVGLQSWVHKVLNANFAFRHFPVVYPSSPVRAYSLHEGKKESIWFDQLALSPNSPEDWGTIRSVGSKLSQLIQKAEQENGIPPENTIIGGFSMGGAMALHLGYGFNSNIAGVFALSSFLTPDSRLYEDMDMKISMNSPPVRFGENNEPLESTTANVKFPKLFMSHGLQDPIVPIRWSKSTFQNLRRRGVDGHFYTIANNKHTISREQLGLLHNWIMNTIYNENDKAPTDTDSTEET